MESNNIYDDAPVEVLGARSSLRAKFMKKGIILALTSGMFYGGYTTFIMVGQTRGPWADWYGDNAAGLSPFVVIYVLGILGAGINDSCSGIWSLIIAAVKGKIGDFGRCFRSKPGLIIIASALIGGPIATSCYVISLQMAGSMIIPITTLYPALGAVIARIFFKQPLTPRMIFGIVLCSIAVVMIGSLSVGNDAKEGMLLGCIIAFVSAICWAIEGVVAGYTMTVMDYEIGITIRQCASGAMNLLIVLPIMCLISGGEGLYATIVTEAVSSWAAMKFFLVSGFLSIFAYSLWYKGNNMCGAALGMAANSAYCIWGPLFCWLVVGIAFGEPGWELPGLVWVAAAIMFIGILFVATNPLALFKRRGGRKDVAA